MTDYDIPRLKWSAGGMLKDDKGGYVFHVDYDNVEIALRLAHAQNRELRKQLADSTSKGSLKFQDGICHDCESPDLCIQDNGCHNTGKVFSRIDRSTCEKAASTSDTEITVEDFKEYVSGWLISGHELDLCHMKSALKNALSQIECDQDGIEAVTERRRFYESERKKKMVGQ